MRYVRFFVTLRYEGLKRNCEKREARHSVSALCFGANAYVEDDTVRIGPADFIPIKDENGKEIGSKPNPYTSQE